MIAGKFSFRKDSLTCFGVQGSNGNKIATILLNNKAKQKIENANQLAGEAEKDLLFAGNEQSFFRVFESK